MCDESVLGQYPECNPLRLLMIVFGKRIHTSYSLELSSVKVTVALTKTMKLQYETEEELPRRLSLKAYKSHCAGSSKLIKDCQVEAIWSFPRQPLNQVISRSDKLWCMNQLIEMAKPNKDNDITDPCTKGMDLAWNLGVRRPEVQVDSKCVVRMLTNQTAGTHQYSNLVRYFQRLRARDWEIQIIHIYREANSLADKLAARGHELDPGMHDIPDTNPKVRRWEDYDKRGISIPRFVMS